MNGVKQILVDWEGHFVPTWTDDDGRVSHNISYAQLRPDLADDDREFVEEIGPEAYGIYCGSLRPVECCTQCTNENQDGLDYRVLVDASRTGNVRHICCSFTMSY